MTAVRRTRPLERPRARFGHRPELAATGLRLDRNREAKQSYSFVVSLATCHRAAVRWRSKNPVLLQFNRREDTPASASCDLFSSCGEIISFDARRMEAYILVTLHDTQRPEQ
jgi:hypothetical protein